MALLLHGRYASSPLDTDGLLLWNINLLNFHVQSSCNDIVVTLGVAISLGILGTTYCDLGELSKAEQLLQKSVDINRRVIDPSILERESLKPCSVEWKGWLESFSQQERHWKVH